MNTIQHLVNQLRGGAMGTEDIQNALTHPSAIVRVSAAEALSLRLPKHPELIQDLVAMARDDLSRIRLMGTITIAHVAVGFLLKSTSIGARAVGEQLLTEWPLEDKGDLIWYLKSEGIQ